MAPADVDLTVYPDECDAFGHLNQASFLALFERARWEMLARGPGMDVFTRDGAWPAVRKASIEYLAAAFPGDVLRFHLMLVHHGRTSFTLRQSARRLRDDVLLATVELVFVCIDAGGRPTPVPEAFTAFLNPPGAAGRRVTVNGVNLAVEVRGDGPAVLFVHGYPLDRSIWAPQLAALDGWRRIAPDLRGMGESDAPDLGYAMATYAEDLVALLDALGVERAVVCGVSMGGYVAFELLRRWRKRVRALVLIATRAEADSPEGRRARDAAAQRAREQGAGSIADAMLPDMLAPTTRERDPALVARVRRVMAGVPVPGIVGALGAMRDRPDNTPLLAALDGLPTLVIAGADDRIIPPDRARAMADRIAGATFALIPAAGHLPTLEAPDATTDAIRTFLDSLAETLPADRAFSR